MKIFPHRIPKYRIPAGPASPASPAEGAELSRCTSSPPREMLSALSARHGELLSSSRSHDAVEMHGQLALQLGLFCPSPFFFFSLTDSLPTWQGCLPPIVIMTGWDENLSKNLILVVASWWLLLLNSSQCCNNQCVGKYRPWVSSGYAGDFKGSQLRLSIPWLTVKTKEKQTLTQWEARVKNCPCEQEGGNLITLSPGKILNISLLTWLRWRKIQSSALQGATRYLSIRASCWSSLHLGTDQFWVRASLTDPAMLFGADILLKSTAGRVGLLLGCLIMKFAQPLVLGQLNVRDCCVRDGNKLLGRWNPLNFVIIPG